MTQEERIEKLKAEVQRLAGNQAVMWGVDQLPADIAEHFLERIIAVEKEEEEDRPTPGQSTARES